MWRPCGVFDTTYAKDLAIVRTSRHWTVLMVSLLVFFLLPFFGSYYIVSFVNTLAIAIVAVLGLQVVSGYCGQISFGQAAFMAVGGYTSAVLTQRYGFSFWMALPEFSPDSTA
jgi:branched-chain amino acid transport system permease protein